MGHRVVDLGRLERECVSQTLLRVGCECNTYHDATLGGKVHVAYYAQLIMQLLEMLLFHSVSHVSLKVLSALITYHTLLAFHLSDGFVPVDFQLLRHLGLGDWQASVAVLELVRR